MFFEIADSYPGPLADLALFPPASARHQWTALPANVKKTVTENCQGKSAADYPRILASDFMAFQKTGNRTDFEALYFTRRRQLNDFILAECINYDGRFMPAIIDGIFLLCEESGWQLPAHNAYIRDTPQLILPDKNRPVLDLFACETGALLAQACFLLAEAFHQVSPLISRRLHQELKERIILPYLNSHFWWMGNGKETLNNWTIWCTQNILITAFSLNLEPSLKQQIFQRAARSIDYFLQEYGEDGCCDEGAGYYRHAGLCLFNTMEILNNVTGDAFASLYEEKKIQNIAAYIQKVHVNDKYYINFADCSAVAGRSGAREFLFGRRTRQPDLMAFAAEDYRAGGANFLLADEINLFYRVQALFTAKELAAFQTALPVTYEDVYFASTGLFIARDNRYVVAVKGGNNDDSHNHNDTGSFTIYKNGQPLFIDVGVESYQKKTFSPERYEIWTMQSSFHNLMEFGGVMEQAGAAYQATNVEWSFADTQASIAMELAKAYPETARLETYQRKVTLQKGCCILVEDYFKSEQEIKVLNLMTWEKPVLENHQLKIGDLATVMITGELADIQIERLPITDRRLKSAWNPHIFRVRLFTYFDSIRLTIH